MKLPSWLAPSWQAPITKHSMVLYRMIETTYLSQSVDNPDSLEAL
ncbi:Hypothetical protein I595_2424 [Croceitalea dokdonensis DOKDO 023]|uniref:Uncharacterized protein n=1 Tax=Croceitalea dokdonensis DOKDO 023 TaxID=1300341 RepID=A0A0P7ATF1_9FLAO|nr:Hypothetical protein I595_2424 [Croceitalea dokdonensis DOKDO 023]